MKPISYETIDQVVGAAGDAGYAIDPARVAKLARAGLVEKGKRRGLGPAQGSFMRYPVGTARQTVQALYLVDRYGKNLGRIRWALLVRGFPIAKRYWEPRVKRIVGLVRDIRFHLLPKGAEDFDLRSEARKQQVIDKLCKLRRLPAGLGAARARSGDKFGTFVGLMIPIITGEYLSVANTGDDYGEDAIRRAYNLKATVPESDPRFLVSNFTVVGLDREFVRIAKTPKRIDMKWFRQIDERQIIQARNEFFPIVLYLAAIEANQVEAAHAPPSQLKWIQTLIAPEQEDEQAGALVVWLLLREDSEFRKSAVALSRQAIEEFHKAGWC